MKSINRHHKPEGENNIEIARPVALTLLELKEVVGAPVWVEDLHTGEIVAAVTGKTTGVIRPGRVMAITFSHKAFYEDDYFHKWLCYTTKPLAYMT